jgi:hypothetical protein
MLTERWSGSDPMVGPIAPCGRDIPNPREIVLRRPHRFPVLPEPGRRSRRIADPDPFRWHHTAQSPESVGLREATRPGGNRGSTVVRTAAEQSAEPSTRGERP